MLLSPSLLQVLRAAKKSAFQFSLEEGIHLTLDTREYNFLPFGVKFLNQVEVKGGTAIVLGTTKTRLWVLSIPQHNLMSFDKCTLDNSLLAVYRENFLLQRSI